MGKKRRLNSTQSRPAKRPPHPASALPSSAKQKQQQNGPKVKSTAGTTNHKQAQHEKPTIPFGPDDRILLIGEGDLSFAASLVAHHRCTSVVATVLEKSAEELKEKYPHTAAENIETITNPPAQRRKAAATGDNEGQEEDDDDDDDDEEDDDNASARQRRNKNKIMYGIDATKPLTASITRRAPTRIIFNFPHVGGKSTDVNRQVRHNQSLLVDFFTRAAIPALAPGGSIIVTLFEAEPYTLWNVRDLARHAGLTVHRSFRFVPDAYPGYRHARTLGVVRSRAGNEGGGWKGEDRPARSYEFVRKGETAAMPIGGGGPAGARRKRRRIGEDDSDDQDDD